MSFLRHADLVDAFTFTYLSLRVYVSCFNMAASSGRFLQRTSAILSRLKHVCTIFCRRANLQYKVLLLHVENCDCLFVGAELGCCLCKVSRRYGNVPYPSKWIGYLLKNLDKMAVNLLKLVESTVESESSLFCFGKVLRNIISTVWLW